MHSAIQHHHQFCSLLQWRVTLQGTLGLRTNRPTADPSRLLYSSLGHARDLDALILDCASYTHSVPRLLHCRYCTRAACGAVHELSRCFTCQEFRHRNGILYVVYLNCGYIDSREASLSMQQNGWRTGHLPALFLLSDSISIICTMCCYISMQRVESVVVYELRMNYAQVPDLLDGRRELLRSLM